MSLYLMVFLYLIHLGGFQAGENNRVVDLSVFQMDIPCFFSIVKIPYCAPQ